MIFGVVSLTGKAVAFRLANEVGEERPSYDGGEQRDVMKWHLAVIADGRRIPLRPAEPGASGLDGVPCGTDLSGKDGMVGIALPGTGLVAFVGIGDVRQAVDGKGRLVPGRVSVRMDPDGTYAVRERDE